MIDQDKLQARCLDWDQLGLAHELAEKCDVEILYGYGTKSGTRTMFFNLNELLKRLQELPQPKPKYEVGQQVWLVDCDTICTANITGYKHGEYRLQKCDTGKDWSVESQLYDSRQALIEAQITHWQNLLSEELEQHVSPYCEPKKQECQHVWIHSPDDVWCYNCKITRPCEHQSMDETELKKCFNCGELYR